MSDKDMVALYNKVMMDAFDDMEEAFKEMREAFEKIKTKELKEALK